MAQIFHRSANSLSRLSILAVVVVVTALLGVAWEIQRAPYVTYQEVAQSQPVPFSHQHHNAGLGIDCRYCHTSVENSNFAGIPPTKTCMNCHSELWTTAPMLEPVRHSYRTGQSLVWTRVNDLPDFVYFSHEIHIAKGVGCDECHGPVDRMPLMFQAKSLQMEWCLDCHRAPDKYLRPKDQVFNMRWQHPDSAHPAKFAGASYTDQETMGRALVKAYGVRSPGDLTSCNTCHR
jgi:hypothetical protein